MGNLLGAPITEKETHTGTTEDGFEYGVSSMQGWRVHMEDAHIAETKLYALEAATSSTAGHGSEPNLIDIPGHSLFAVFDGHGGTFAAAYSGRNMCRVLSHQDKFVQYAKFEAERPEKMKSIQTEREINAYLYSGIELLKDALRDAFVELDKEIACALKGHPVSNADRGYMQFYNQQNGIHAPVNTDKDTNLDGTARATNVAGKEPVGGASSVTPATDAALRMLEEEGDSGTTACLVILTPVWIVCANAGDSRAVLGRAGGQPTALSYDHKPDDELEERRIRAAGGYVAGGRVEGDLAVSRGLGDFRFKNIAVVLSAPLVGGPNETEVALIIGNGTKNESKHDSQTQQRSNSMKPGDQKVSPIPDIIVHKRSEAQDEFVVLACDGIWDVQTNYEAIKTVADMLREGETNVGLICEEVRHLRSHALGENRFVPCHSPLTDF